MTKSELRAEEAEYDFKVGDVVIDVSCMMRDGTTKQVIVESVDESYLPEARCTLRDVTGYTYRQSGLIIPVAHALSILQTGAKVLRGEVTAEKLS